MNSQNTEIEKTKIRWMSGTFNILLNIVGYLVLLILFLVGFAVSKNMFDPEAAIIILSGLLVSIFVINVVKVFIGYNPLFLPKSHGFGGVLVLLQGVMLIGLALIFYKLYLLGIGVILVSGVITFLLAKELLIAGFVRSMWIAKFLHKIGL